VVYEDNTMDRLRGRLGSGEVRGRVGTKRFGESQSDTGQKETPESQDHVLLPD
jgi:hypothetical protein